VDEPFEPHEHDRRFHLRSGVDPGKGPGPGGLPPDRNRPRVIEGMPASRGIRSPWWSHRLSGRFGRPKTCPPPRLVRGITASSSPSASATHSGERGIDDGTTSCDRFCRTARRLVAYALLPARTGRASSSPRGARRMPRPLARAGCVHGMTRPVRRLPDRPGGTRSARFGRAAAAPHHVDRGGRERLASGSSGPRIGSRSFRHLPADRSSLRRPPLRRGRARCHGHDGPAGSRRTTTDTAASPARIPESSSAPHPARAGGTG